MNANCFKTVFSERLGCLVAVGEHACSQGKSSGESAFGRSAFGASVLASSGVFIGALVLSQVFVGLAWAQPAANALPTGGTVVQGAASLAQSANQLNITQSSQRAAINWQSFDIGASAKVNVVQPNAQAVLLNRVVGQSPSQIFGQLQANGHVILVNPNGVLFGKDGSVNAGSFTASTLGITDANFMAGNMVYERNGSTAGVVNQGTIEVSPGGYVALLGASVSNEGKIIAPKGGVALGAAETIKVPVTGSGRIKLELTAGDINASVKNSGAIVSEGGQVYMQALALNRAAAQILQSGRIDTTGEQGGAVHLLADGGTIKVDGSITANSTGTDDKGQARKGGDIVIGRDEETGTLAASTDVSAARLRSMGGFVETSGHVLNVDSAQVIAKDWLLDPDNIDITGDAIAATSGYSKIKASDIATALNAGTSVTVSTTAGTQVNQPGYTDTAGTGAGTATAGDGNILVNAAIVKSGSNNASLTLLADNGITVNQRIGRAAADTTSNGKLDVVMTANGGVEGTSSKGITLNNVIDANGGQVTLTGTSKDTSGVQTGPTYTYGVTNNSRSGVVFNTGSGIIADNYQVTGTHTVAAGNSFGVNGVYMSGAVTFKAAGNTDSNITGVSNAQGNFGAGVMVWDGASVRLENQGTGITTLKGSNTNTAGGNGIRIGASTNTATINAIGRVTLGQKAAGVNAPVFVRGVINASQNTSSLGGLSILGQTGTGLNTSAVQIWDTNINATGMDVLLDGVTNNGTGVYIQTAPNNTWTTKNLTVSGVANTTSGSSGAGVVVQRYPGVLTVNASGNIAIEGSVQGTGSGSGLSFAQSGWGPQSPSLTATGNITLRGNNRASTSNTSNAVSIASGVQVSASGNIVLQAETNNAAATAIYANSAGNFADWAAASNAGAGALNGNMSLKSTSGDVLIQSNQGSIVLNNQLTSTLVNGTQTTSTDISGRNITIDNTGAGMATGAGTAATGTGGTQGATLGSGSIDAATGVITRGAGKSTSSTAGVRMADGRGITAKNNINIFGAGTTGSGVEISGAAALSANVVGYTGNINIAGENTTSSGAAINISNASSTITALNIATLTSSGTGSGTSLVAAGNITVGGELQVENPSSGTISGVIGGTGMLRKRGGTGAGTLTLTGENTYTGGTTANGGMLQVGNGGTTGTLGVGGAISVGAALSFKRSNTLEISQNISGVGQISQIGTGTTILTGTNSYSGTTTISSGGLQIGHSGTTGTLGAGTVSVASGANLSFKRSDTWTVANAISGAGNLTQEGTGTTVLTGANTYTGTTTISAGALQIGDGGSSGALGSGAVVNNASLIFNRSNALTIANVISGSGGLIQRGTGTTVLSADNSYGGTTVVSGGTLQLGNAGTTGTLGAGAVTLSNNANLSYVRSADTTIANSISGVGSLSASITGVGSDLTIANAVALTDGTVNLAADGHLTVTQSLGTTNATSSAIVMTSGKAISAGTASGGDISFSGSGAVSVGTGGRATLYTGSLAGSAGLGIVAGNNRYNSDELASNYTSALGTGVYAIYREAPTLSINVSNASKTYDGAAFIGGNGFTESGATGLKNGDTLSSALSSAAWGGTAQNAVNAGTYTLSASESVAGKSALGYVTTYTSGTLSVNKKDVSLANITAANKTYDGSDAAAITAGSISTGVGTETLLINGSGTFSDKNAADGKTVTVADVTALTKTNGTGDWNNYNLTTTGAMTTTANITKKDVSLASITAANKAYDGNDAATITAGNISTGVGSETLLISGSGTFSNKNAADGKTVTVADVTALTKTNGTGDWGNYNLTTTGSMATTANIAKKDVSLTSITAANKVYDGSDAATITAGSINTGVGTETLFISGSGTFSDKNADVNKTVTVADVTALTKTNGTGDWSNYNLITTGPKTTTATIDKATLSAALTGTVEKVYDGTTAASNLVNANFAVTGWVAGEGATVSQTAASYSSKNVSDNIGTGAVSAVLSSSHFTAAAGTLLSNYELPTTASGNVGKITPAPLVVKVNDSAAFVTMNASQATDNGLSYTGFVNGENAASALTGIGTRTYLPASQTPVAGTYTEAFGLSTTPTALNGNYTVTVQKGDLTVVPADKLLITIAGKTETYGVLTAANAGLSASTVTAQYCLTSNCSSSLVDLTVSRLPDGRWQATDATGTSVTFSTLVDTTGKISTGGFVNAGNYTYDASNTLPPSGTNFNGRVVNGGVLTIDPKAVTLEASGVTKTYDGSMALAGRSVDITNAMSGDQVSASSSGGSFVGKNAGTQGYTLTGLSLSGADSANYSIATQLSGSDGRIDTRSVILTAGSVVKTYDGSTTYAVTQADLDALSLQLVPGDRVTAAQLVFADKNVSRAGNGTVLSDKTVTLNSVTLNDGNSGGNYSLTLQGNQTSTINPKTLQAAGAVADKVYDGTRLATLGDLSGSGVVAGDVVSFQASSALFDSKNVLRDGGGQVLDRMVTVSGLTLGGPQAGNYDLSSGSFTTQAKILPLELYVEASAQNKTYDGTRAASGTLDMTGVLTGESVSLNWGAGQFASKDVARDGTGQVTAQTVTFAGLQLAGPDADNYSLALTTATTTARITPKLLSVSGTRVANKTQDGTTQAEASAGSLSGLVGAEMLQAVAMASFDSASAGSNKNVTVRYSLANGSNGGLAGNYELMDEVFTASILAQAGGNPVQPLVIPAESTVQSYLRSSGSSATAVTTSKPELESRNECSSLTPEDCDCQPSTLSGVDICMVPLKVVRDRPGLQLGVTSLRD